jgi:hypothetical protein
MALQPLGKGDPGVAEAAQACRPQGMGLRATTVRDAAGRARKPDAAGGISTVAPG